MGQFLELAKMIRGVCAFVTVELRSPAANDSHHVLTTRWQPPYNEAEYEAVREFWEEKTTPPATAAATTTAANLPESLTPGGGAGTNSTESKALESDDSSAV